MQSFPFPGLRAWRIILDNLFRASERRLSIRQRWARLGCETLEDRLAPANITLPVLNGGGAFGASVALAGNNVLVGAPTSIGNEGAAYLYNTAGILLLAFNDPGNTAGDRFGISVALLGNDVLIGADGAGGAEGAAYLFNTSGALLQTFNDPRETANDFFGTSVALSGNDVLVGASNGEHGAANVGAAYLFNTAGTLLRNFNDPGAIVADCFGTSVALSGNDLLIGAFGTNSNQGTAYLYDTAGNLLQTFNDPGNSQDDYFAYSLALSGDNVLLCGIGLNDDRGEAYLYNTSGTLLHTYYDPGDMEPDNFGEAAALSGNEVLVGAIHGSEEVGAAYLFNTSGALLQTFNDPDMTLYEGFGTELALSSSGVLLGSGPTIGGGAAYLYTSEISALYGNNQSTTAGSAFGAALAAQVTEGGPVEDVPVTFTVADGPTGAGASFPGAATVIVTSDVDGLAIAPPLTANGIAGSFTVTASSGGASTTFDLTNTNGAPAFIVADGGTPQDTVEGSAFGTLLQALVTDSDGNPVADASVTFAVPSFGPTGTFDASATVPTNAFGIATAPMLAANHQVGSFSVTASVGGAATPADFDLTNTLIPAAISVKAGAGQRATVATSYAPPLEVLVVNAANQPVSGISVDFETPGSGAGGTFAVGSAVTNAVGIATAPTLTANTTAGSFSVAAWVADVARPAVFTLNNTAGAAHTISVFAGSGQSANVANTYKAALQALVVDQYGNPVYGAGVTFSIVANGAVGATFLADKTTATAASNAAGIAIAPTLTANIKAGTFTVTAKVNGVATPATFDLTNDPSPLLLAPKGLAESGGVGQVYAQFLEARVTDPYGNPVPGLAVTFTAPATGASGTFAGQNRSATATTNADGVATAPTFTANTKAGGFVVTLTTHGAPTGEITLTNLPGPAADVKVVIDPKRTTTLDGIVRDLDVRVTDEYGNVIASESVTFAVQGDPVSGADGTFTGQTTATVSTNAAGIAAAPPLEANAERGAFTVTATVLGVAASADFDVTIS